MDWTAAQRETIESRGKDLLVAAAAGSGKTAVLTERIRRLVTEDRVPLSEMLVVTFTDAAAAEMRQRITKSLEDALGTGASDPFLEEQLYRIGAARISTFHAFALSVIREHFPVIGLDPSFQPADERRADILREEAMDALLEECFSAEDNAAFPDFCDAYGSLKSERPVREMIAETYAFIRALPDPFAWLRAKVDELAESGASGGVLRTPSAREEITETLRFAAQTFETITRFLAKNGFGRFAEKSAADAENVRTVLAQFEAGDSEGAAAALDALKLTALSPAKAEKEAGWDEFKEAVSKRRSSAKDSLKALLPAYFARGAEDGAAVLPFARTLEALVARFHEIYSEAKRREGLIDFADFEHFALAILADDGVADAYRSRIRYLFVDEYQDCSPVQEALVDRLKSPGGLFFVGDVKQSIYGFRNAEPGLFLEKYNRYPPEEREGAAERRIDLSENFRSKRGILDAANAVFERLMERRSSGLDYDERARLRPGLCYEAKWDRRPALHLLRKDREKARYGSDAEGEAAVCAQIIRETVGTVFYDAKAGACRPYEYRDIVILLRNANTHGETFRRALAERGVPAYAETGASYFETVEIGAFLALLRVIDNLRQDVPLAAAMCSPVFGFTPADLARIRLASREGDFYPAFIEMAENGEDGALQEKCAAMRVRIEGWRREERFLRLDDFLWKLMRESGYYEYAGALPGGAQRQANLRALLDRAGAYQKGRVRGLYGFLAMLDEITERSETPQVSLLSAGDDVVRILTIHKSKGLEYPMALLCQLGASLKAAGRENSKLLLHREAGIALELVDAARHTRRKTPLHQVVKRKKEAGERAENIRLLYVAMTRAMDRLHLVGTAPDPEQALAEYAGMEAFIETDARCAGNYLQMLLPVCCARQDLFEIRTEANEITLAADNEAGFCGAPQKPASLSAVLAPSPEPPSAPFAYPYASSVSLRSKYSVSALAQKMSEKTLTKETGHEPAVRWSADETAEDAGLSAGLTAAEKGTALHRAIERMDFAEAVRYKGEPRWFEALLENLKNGGVLSEAEYASVSPETLRLFAGSPLCARASSSPLCLKEAPFNSLMVFPGEEGKENAGEIMVQGVIDCLFRDEAGLVIVDYKSGPFASDKTGEDARIRAAYGAQLALYRRAAERIFGERAAEAWIYMTRTGTCIPI